MVERNQMDIEKRDHATLGRWTLLKTLGTGYNSKVKLGYDPETGTHGAVKTIKLDHPSLNLSNLKKEVNILKSLKHPHMVNLLEFHETADYIKRDGRVVKVVAIVMELALGGELFEYVADSGRFSEPVARFYFKQIIEALSYLHKEGYAHRDMKPENILFDENFNLKLADFGFTTLLAGKDGSYLLETNLGTEAYMAPEIHERKPYSGAAVDLFATAIILFIMYSGTPPFARADNTRDPHYKAFSQGRFELYWNAHEKNKPKKPFFSEDFRDLMQKMLALDPKDRLDIEGIKAHPWYNGTTSNLKEVQAEFKQRKEKVDDELRKQKEQRERERARRAQLATGAFTGITPFRDGELEKDLDKQLKDLKFRSSKDDLKTTFDPQAQRFIKKFEGRVTNPVTQQLIVMAPQVLLKQLLVLSNSAFETLTVGKDNYKIKGTVKTDEGTIDVAINITSIDEDTQCVEFTKKKGDLLNYFKFIEEKFANPLKEISNVVSKEESA